MQECSNEEGLAKEPADRKPVYVAPDVKIFDGLTIGDNVTVRVIESVIVAVRPDLKPICDASFT
jgi:serine acetyltransferase